MPDTMVSGGLVLRASAALAAQGYATAPELNSGTWANVGTRGPARDRIERRPRAGCFVDRALIRAGRQVHQGLQGHYRDILTTYWQQTIESLENDTHDYKQHQLPLARIKKVMKADPEVKMISAEAPILFAKGCDIFITELTMRAWIHAEENKRRTLQRSDIASALAKSDMFDFLIDIVPREEAVSHSKRTTSTAGTVGGTGGGGGGSSGGGGGSAGGTQPSASAVATQHQSAPAAPPQAPHPPHQPAPAPLHPPQAQAHAHPHAHAHAHAHAMAPQHHEYPSSLGPHEINAAEYHRQSAAHAPSMFAPGGPLPTLQVGGPPPPGSGAYGTHPSHPHQHPQHHHSHPQQHPQQHPHPHQHPPPHMYADMEGMYGYPTMPSQPMYQMPPPRRSTTTSANPASGLLRDRADHHPYHRRLSNSLGAGRGEAEAEAETDPEADAEGERDYDVG
ncbi:MAG: hypothetical protein M1826_007243 [Phylliscum demangeonii]|nr:MAG: hypothetical protein M1826_007243 [Phylliscum demangeonii]